VKYKRGRSIYVATLQFVEKAKNKNIERSEQKSFRQAFFQKACRG